MDDRLFSAAASAASSSRLSAAAEQRRTAIRSVLMARMVGRRRRRRAATAALLVVIAWLAGGVIQGAWNPAAGNQRSVIATGAGHGSAQQAAPVAVQIMARDPGVLARYRVVLVDSVARLDDAELLAALRARGVRGGLLRIADRAEVSGFEPDDWQLEAP